MISNETTFEGIQHGPNEILGYRENGMPIYTIAGGSVAASVGGDDPNDDDAGSVLSDSDDDGADDADAWVPPTREEFDKLKQEKAKADSESAARKRFLRDRGFDPKTGEPIVKPSVNLSMDDDASDTETPVADAAPKFDRDKFEKAAQRTLEREIAKAESAARRSSLELIHEVPKALDDAGFNQKHLGRALKFLDLDTLEIDSDGIDRDELHARIASLKEDLPEFFKRTRMKDAAKDVADAGTVGGGNKQAPASDEAKDWTQRMKDQLLRGN